MSYLKTVVEKLMSARFLVTIGLTLTACIMAYKGSFPMEAFTGLVTLAVRDYFQRADRDLPANGPTKSNGA